MYENKTYESLLQEKLARVASTYDKREGSVIFDALAPNSIEAASLYILADTILNETYADTASLYYLKKRNYLLYCNKKHLEVLLVKQKHQLQENV